MGLKQAAAPPRDSLIAMGALRQAAAATVGEGYTVIETIHDSPLVTRRVGGRDKDGDAPLPSSGGQTQLHVCAKYGRLDGLSRLLASRLSDVNAKDVDGRTPLHLACIGGHALCIDPLVRAGANVTAVDSRGCTALQLAVKYRRVDVVQVLLKYAGQSLDMPDNNLRTPLHDAVLTGSEQLCRLMILSGAATHMKDAFGRTPLMLACSAGLLGVASCLFQEHLVSTSGAAALEPSAIEDNEGAVAIHYAVLRNRLPLVELVAKRTAEINKPKRDGTTAIHLAALKGYRGALGALIGAGALVNVMDAEGATPLHRASSHNQHDCVEVLMQQGADVSIRDNNGRTACHLAAAAGHSDVLTRLLKVVDAQELVYDNGMQTPLHYACNAARADCVNALLSWAAAKDQEVLRSLLYAPDNTGRIAAHLAASRPDGSAALALLLQHGSSTLSWTDEAMKTPLHHAAEQDCPDNVELLLDHNADMAATDLEGCTALHLACMKGCKASAALLLSRGASSSLREWQGRQPLLLASQAAHASVVRLLLENGCEVNALDGQGCNALHLACTADAADVTKLLVDAGCDLCTKDSTSATPLQRAIAGRCAQAAAAIIMHEKWELAMSTMDGRGFTPMQDLIKCLPKVAKIVLDHSIKVRNTGSASDAGMSVVHDYRHIDPHPDDLCCSQKKQWFVHTMATQQQEELLFHPLTQSNIAYKWSRFGLLLHWFRFGTFLVYLALLTAYTFTAPGIAAAPSLDLYGCPISNATNSSMAAEYQKSGQGAQAYVIHSKDHIVIFLQTMLLVISSIYFAEELVAMVISRQSYFLKSSSYISLPLIGTTAGFASPPGFYPCLNQWRCGWIANLLAWASLVLCLRSFDFIGIYVLMFTAVTKSLLKLMVLLMVFFLGFSVVFNLLQNEQTQFSGIPNALLSVFDMALGEINFSSNFLGATNVFAKDSLWAVAIFMFLINIVLINLTVGITIGDIEEMRASARFQMMAQKVEWLHHYETNFPIRLRRRFYAKEYVKRASTPSPAKSCMVALIKKVNDAIAIPLDRARPQQFSPEDLNMELQDLKTQITSLTRLVQGLKHSSTRLPDKNGDPSADSGRHRML